jgi:hypothetical protein
MINTFLAGSAYKLVETDSIAVSKMRIGNFTAFLNKLLKLLLG